MLIRVEQGKGKKDRYTILSAFYHAKKKPVLKKAAAFMY
jgi:hypothetical protein